MNMYNINKSNIPIFVINEKLLSVIKILITNTINKMIYMYNQHLYHHFRES